MESIRRLAQEAEAAVSDFFVEAEWDQFETLSDVEKIQWRYCHADCDDFAATLSEITGWPIVGLTSPNGLPLHRLIESPDGRLLDAMGWTNLKALAERYKNSDLADNDRSNSRDNLVPVRQYKYGDFAFSRGHNVCHSLICEDEDYHSHVEAILNLPVSPFSEPNFRCKAIAFAKSVGMNVPEQANANQPVPSTTIDLLAFPREERLKAVKQIMATARNLGLDGNADESATIAIAMNACLFAGRGVIVAGMNKEFMKHQKMVGHFVLCIPDDELEVLNLNKFGTPIGNDEVIGLSMLDHQDPDWIADARALGFELTETIAEDVELHVFDDEQECLNKVPGAGVTQKYALLALAIEDFMNQDLRLSPADRTPEQSEEFERRVFAAQDLNNRSGVTYLFWENAKRAIYAASAPDKPNFMDWNRPIDWKAVEDATIFAALGVRQHSPEEVVNVLRKYSPGVLTEKQFEAVQHRVDAYVRVGIGIPMSLPTPASASRLRVAP